MGFNRDKAAARYSGSDTKAWKNPTISPIPMCVPRKSSKTSKPPRVFVRSMELFDACAISTETINRGNY